MAITHGTPTDAKPIQVTTEFSTHYLSFTGFGWNNLRLFIWSDTPDFDVHESHATNIPYWYVCGRRQFWSISEPFSFDGTRHTIVGGIQPDEMRSGNLQVQPLSAQLELWTGDANNPDQAKSEIMASVSKACSAPPQKQEPPNFEVYRNQNEDRIGYLLTKDFDIDGTVRRYWLREHTARNAKVIPKPGSSYEAFLRKRAQTSATAKELLDGYTTNLVSPSVRLIVRYEADCTQRTLRQLTGVQYHKNGSVEYSFDTPEPKASLVIPGTVGEAHLEKACQILP